MFWIAIGFGLGGVVVLIRWFLLKREIRKAVRQLRQYNQEVTGKKLDVAFMDRDLETLAQEINRQIDQTRKANAEKTRTENELKAAISNISHDIRTPMTSILGYIQLIEGEDLPEEKKKEYTQIVRKGALRLKTLLEDFFELSLIESPDYALSLEPVALHEVLPECLVGFYEEFHQRGIEPALLLPEEEVRILADPSAVKRVIENLVTNAIRYSGGHVTLQLEQTAAAVRLAICNPAPQLRKEELPFLFDRFYKTDRPRAGKGTGLGLSIAKSLMLKMRGTLTAELQGTELHMVCEWPKTPKEDKSPPWG